MPEKMYSLPFHNCVADVETKHVDELYNIIRFSQDHAVADTTDHDFYYDKYLPNFIEFNIKSTSMARRVSENLDLYASDDELEKIAQSVARGLRAGYLLAKTELENA